MKLHPQGIAGLVVGCVSVILWFMPLIGVAEEFFSPRDPCAPIFRSPCAEINGVKKSKWFVGGHLEAGLYVNQYGRRNSYGSGFLDPASGNTASLFNVRQSDGQLNQLYFKAGKKLDTRRGFDIGGRVDFMYGTDAVFVQSDGFEWDGDRSSWNSGDYYTAIPQLFVEAGYGNFSVKLGKFLSPMGGESILSPERFFYSLSPVSMELPQTFTGIVGTWEVDRRLSVLGGWVKAEDDSFSGRRDAAFLGDVYYQWTKRVRIGYSAFVRMSSRDRIDGDAFAQSFTVNYIGSKWDYRFEWMLRNPRTGVARRLDAYGLRQELVYKFDANWSLGGRLDWMRRHTKSGLPYDRYSLTFGVNWKPRPWITFRPEIRYDRNDGTKPYNKPKDGSPGGRCDQITGGFSTVITF